MSYNENDDMLMELDYVTSDEMARECDHDDDYDHADDSDWPDYADYLDAFSYDAGMHDHDEL